MRILTVCTSTKVFGAETITLKLLEGFKKRGHEQLAVTSIWTDGEFNQRLGKLGLADVRLPFGFLSKVLKPQPLWWTVKVLARMPFLWLQWTRLVHRFQPDVILFTTFRQPILLGPVLGRRRISFLIEHSNANPTRIKRWAYLWIAKRLNGFIAVSSFTAEHLRTLDVPEEKVHMVRNGLFSQEDRERIAREATITEPTLHRTFFIGIVGQIAASKGHDDLLEAVRLLREEKFLVEVRVFGNGEAQYVTALSNKIAQYGLDTVWHWMGYERDPRAIYSGLSLCVMPSFSEAFGLSAAEASAYGLPVVASKVGGLPEVILNDKTGFLVSPHDPFELAAKIRRLIENPDIAQDMGKRGREHVFGQFAQERMVSDFERLFGNVRSRNPPTEMHAN